MVVVLGQERGLATPVALSDGLCQHLGIGQKEALFILFMENAVPCGLQLVAELQKFVGHVGCPALR